MIVFSLKLLIIPIGCLIFSGVVSGGRGKCKCGEGESGREIADSTFSTSSRYLSSLWMGTGSN